LIFSAIIRPETEKSESHQKGQLAEIDIQDLTVASVRKSGESFYLLYPYSIICQNRRYGKNRGGDDGLVFFAPVLGPPPAGVRADAETGYIESDLLEPDTDI